MEFLSYNSPLLRIELDCFTIYKLLDVLFCQRRLLKIEIERPHTHRFLVYIVQRRQIWVAQRLINYNRTYKPMFRRLKRNDKTEIYETHQ